MGVDDEPRFLASEALPRVSPELALVDAVMAEGLRRRERVLARRRSLPFASLRVVQEPEAQPRAADEPAGAA